MLRCTFLASAGALALAGTAFAADLPSRGPPPVYLPPPPIWTGWYAGLNAGYSWSASNNVQTSTVNLIDFTDGGAARVEGEGAGAALSQTGTSSANANGFIGGGQLGYNYQISNFVVGLEADIQGAGVRGRGSFTGFGVDTFPDDQITSVVETEKTVDWLGTVRGRLGWLITPTWLLYGTGGFAYGGVTAHSTFASTWTNPVETLTEQWPGVSAGFSGTRTGWTAGGGLEWMFLPNWSLKAEYLYYDLGSATWGATLQSIDFFDFDHGSTNFAQSHTRFNGHIVRAGLNYHFNWGAAPVVARY